eukprot:CAMPEP_0177688162 /NCGR_PEP_ID=MMETSP0447-20121125/34515_1 /TAXON_ID=0 /ORGANISM="Stygamoeba regulata, Strain BSH-02190019" /LENGTH=185 /DNA_ID=CAMNT_0019198453 /DNA_START=43 /DNA_END=600 /DNA_ORIENTATION=-
MATTMLAITLALLGMACGSALPQSAAMAGIKSYNKVTMSVPHLNHTEEWYHDTLGFETVAKTTVVLRMGEQPIQLLLMKLPDTEVEIEFIQDPSAAGGVVHAPAPHQYRIFGISQFSFIVDSLEASVGSLRKRGVIMDFCSKIDATGHNISFFQDLNGNVVQLVELCRCKGEGCCPSLPDSCPSV